MKLNGDEDKESSSSDDDMDRDDNDGDSSEDDEKEGIQHVVLPRVMPIIDKSNSSDDDSEDDQAKGFLANTMGLLKDQKAGQTQQTTNNNSKIASDLDALFSKFV